MEKKMLVTPLRQIALNGNRREVLPGLSRTWAGDIMSPMLPHCLLGDSPVCAVVHSTVVLLLLEFCLLFRSAA